MRARPLARFRGCPADRQSSRLGAQNKGAANKAVCNWMRYFCTRQDSSALFCCITAVSSSMANLCGVGLITLTCRSNGSVQRGSRTLETRLRLPAAGNKTCPRPADHESCSPQPQRDRQLANISARHCRPTSLETHGRFSCVLAISPFSRRKCRDAHSSP